MSALDKLLLNTTVLTLSKILNDPSLCLVGGAVRDCLEGKDDSLDFDFSTKLTPDVVKSILEKNDLPCYNAIRRGTVFTRLNYQRVDITTFRNPEKESEYVTTIEEDLAARDFTINAMAINIASKRLIDPYGGSEDLANRLVRCVGDPTKRFIEDPHRLIRLVRFSSAAGRTVDTHSLESARSLAHLIQQVAPERICMELYKIITSTYAGEGFKDLYNLGLLKYIIPELCDCVGCSQNTYHLYDVFQHTLAVLDAIDPEMHYARIAALFHDIGKPLSKTVDETGKIQFLGHEETSFNLCKTIMSRLKFSGYAISQVSTLVKEHMRSTKGGKKSIRRLIKDLEHENYCLEDWLALKEADLVHGGRPCKESLAQEWEQFVQLLNHLRWEEPKKTPIKTLNINGNDIKNLGFKEGPIIGEILKYLEDCILEDPNLNNINSLTTMVKDKYKI